MKRSISLLLFTFCICVSLPGSGSVDYITNAAEIVKSANWKEMKTLTIVFDEFSYEPENIVLEAGQPYKLELKNTGEKKHYFTAPEFYRAIATRKVQSNRDGEIKAPYFTALELMVNGQLDLYFVPVTRGEYPVYCTIDDHKEEGMSGKLVIR